MFPTVFFNFSGRDYPDYSKKTFNSLAVENGMVTDHGFGLETLSHYQHHTKVDLEGDVLLPGFADAHVHFLQTGLNLVGCDLQSAGSIPEIQSILGDYARKAAGNWLVAWNLDETRIAEKRLPLPGEIDAAIPNRRVWIHRIDLHSAVPNSKAAEWALSAIPDSRLENGRFLKSDYSRLWGLILRELPRELKREALVGARLTCLRNGVTSVHALEGGMGSSSEDVQMTADYLGELGFHGVVYHQSEEPSLAKANRWPRLGGCLLVDGSFGSRTAALNAPYADDPGNSGALYRDQAGLEELISMCLRERLQLAMHAIGDRAIDALVKVHHNLFRRFGQPPLPHRIEHFELPTDRAIMMAREAQLSISVQPAFDVFWGGPGGMYERRLGPDRAARTNPFRTLLEKGLSLAGGSDSPVTPIDPMLGIYGFIAHSNADERIDLNTAIEAFAFQPHRFSGEFTTRGRLRKGFHADFNCFSKDPFLIPPRELRELKPSRTFVGGVEPLTSPF